jgi:hypothetical protein
METIDEQPKVIQNSDFLYKTDVKWHFDGTYIEPTQYEKDMLKNTKNPKELIEEESKEEIKELSEEEKKKNIITMIKVVSLNKMNFFPLYNASNLQPHHKETLKTQMEILLQLWNDGYSNDIINEFNQICNEKLFANSLDVSTYPVYNNV